MYDLTSRRRVLFGILYGACSAMVPRPRFYAADASTKEALPCKNPGFHFKGNANTTAWLDFEMPDSERITLTGKINQAPVKILIDSGVGGLVLDNGLAAALNLHSIGSVTGVGVAGQVKGEVAEAVQVAFDNLTIDAPSPALFDLSPLRRSSMSPSSRSLAEISSTGWLLILTSRIKKLPFAVPRRGRCCPVARNCRWCVARQVGAGLLSR